MWKNYKSLWQKTFQSSHDRNKRKCCLHLDSIERKAYFITIRRCCIKMWHSSVYYMEYTRTVCINIYTFLVCEVMTKIETLISVAIYWVCRLGLTASEWMCSLKISYSKKIVYCNLKYLQFVDMSLPMECSWNGKWQDSFKILQFHFLVFYFSFLFRNMNFLRSKTNLCFVTWTTKLLICPVIFYICMKFLKYTGVCVCVKYTLLKVCVASQSFM